LALGGLIVIVSAGRGWGTATMADVAGAKAGRALRVNGTDVSGGLSALGLLSLAGVLAVLATRGPVRRAVAVVLALVGVSVVALAVTGDVRAALDKAARTAGGVSTARADGVSTSAWPWVCALGGACIVAAAGLVVVRGRQWPSLGARYERGAARTPRVLDPWSALDRGIDPTLDPAGDATTDAGPDKMRSDT
jgi:uncharacterized membrane protein (TIGR02234 family)